MSDLYWLTDEQMDRLRPFFPRATAGQISDYTGATALLDSLPAAQCMLGDRGCDADWFRDAHPRRKRDQILHPKMEIPRKSCQI